MASTTVVLEQPILPKIKILNIRIYKPDQILIKIVIAQNILTIATLRLYKLGNKLSSKILNFYNLNSNNKLR